MEEEIKKKFNFKKIVVFILAIIAVYYYLFDKTNKDKK